MVEAGLLTYLVALFPGLPTVQFWITCSKNWMVGRPGTRL